MRGTLSLEDMPTFPLSVHAVSGFHFQAQFFTRLLILVIVTAAFDECSCMTPHQSTLSTLPFQSLRPSYEAGTYSTPTAQMRKETDYPKGSQWQNQG